ncbi:hypothetical protein BB777_14920 [Planococcus faecalis]|nr:hypothetical protein BB777_14920 [Planococcus faecalis]
MNQQTKRAKLILNQEKSKRLKTLKLKLILVRQIVLQTKKQIIQLQIQTRIRKPINLYMIRVEI